MPEALRRRDRVSWSRGSGRSRGTIERVITTRTKVGGRTVAGSRSDPRYLVRDERTGATAVRRGAGLRRLTPAEPAARRRDWRVAAGVAVGALVTAIVGIYFVHLPNRLADDYRDDAGPAFERVDEAMYDVYDSFRADYFRGLAVEELTRKRVGENLARLRRAYVEQYSSDRGSIERARGNIAEAKRIIAEAESELTEVGTLPLLGAMGDLDDAGEHADRADAYLVEARAFLAEFEELLAYNKQSVDLEEDITGAILDNDPGSGGTLSTYRDAVADTLDGLRNVERRFKRLDPPDVADPFEYATRVGLDISIDYFEQLRIGLQQLDIDRLDRADAALVRKVRRFGIAVLTRFADLQADSSLGERIAELEREEESLAADLDVDAGLESPVPPLLPPDDTGEKSEA